MTGLKLLMLLTSTSVFVCHSGMEVGKKHLDGHLYWKMKVSTIHEDQDGKTWIVGEWYYSPSDLKTVNLCKGWASALSGAV
jgi:hypothetical protein